MKLQMRMEHHLRPVDISFEYSKSNDDYLVIARTEEGRDWILENMRHPIISDEFERQIHPYEKFYGVFSLREQYFASSQYEGVFVSDWTIADYTPIDATVEAFKRVIVEKVMATLGDDGERCLRVTFPEFPLLSVIQKNKTDRPVNLMDTRETVRDLLSWVFFNQDVYTTSKQKLEMQDKYHYLGEG
jgi:hypothetical protein